MKTIISTEKAPAAIGPYSQGVAGEHIVFVSGQLPIDMTTGKMPETIEEQAKASLTNVRSILEAKGLTMDNVVKTTVFLQNIDDFTAMNDVYKEFFTEGNYPARSAVEVARIPKGAMLEIEAIALA